MSDFKSSLLTLGDEAFFELVRNYLGPIKTPFNKHDLIDRLHTFLRREAIRERIVALIDEEDAELLSAVWLLGEPDIDELYLLFAGDRSYLDLHQRLLNLEDRLLVYRERDRLVINPILRDLLEERVLRAERLFSSRPLADHEQPPPPPWVTDTLLICLYSYAQEGRELFRADHALRKRAHGDLSERIPPLADAAGTGAETTTAGTAETVHRATILVDALLRLGALTNAGGLAVVHDVWERLAGNSSAGRLATLAAAAALGGHGNEPRRPAGQAIAHVAEAVEAVIESLPRERAIDSRSVERLLLVLAPDISAETCRRAREAMTLLGLLMRSTDDAVRVAATPQPVEETKPLVVQPNFDVTLPEEFGFDDALFVARVAELRRYDRYPHLELTKERLATALRDGEELEHVLERLQSLAGGTVPQNVLVTMRGWAGEYESVRLFRGVVLTVEPARRHAVEHAQAVSSLIRRELAPGVYLVNETDVPALQEALTGAGIELVPEVASASRAPMVIAAPRSESIDRTRLETFRRVFDSSRTPTRLAPAAKPDWVSDLETRLDEYGASGKLSAEQRDELATRLRQKLIVSDDQIQGGAVRSEKTEARGLDYVGKVRIIEHAIRSGSSLLEVIERTEDGSPRRRLIEPSDMSKRENELVLAGEELPGRTPVEVLVSKLGLVRRLRTGLVKRRPSRR